MFIYFGKILNLTNCVCLSVESRIEDERSNPVEPNLCIKFCFVVEILIGIKNEKNRLINIKFMDKKPFYKVSGDGVLIV